MRQGAASTLQPETKMTQTTADSRDFDIGFALPVRPASDPPARNPSIPEPSRRLAIRAGAALGIGLGFGVGFGSRAALAQPAAPVDVPYVPTPPETVAAMLDVAQVRARDVVYDLGSGDGRIPIAAARRGARAVGIDIDPRRIAEARENARKAGVEKRVRFIQADLFEQDLSAATVITLYLLPQLNLRLRPTLLALAPGTRIVSHGFDMGDWRPDRTITAGGSLVHFWRVPPRTT
jgi:SAM-dependent methyltransferase